MDMQGKPIGITGSGTKNTSTPAEPVQEGPGAIAKDSLAAESSAYPDQYTSGVEGSSSTFNNTDTSGATTLPPAARAEDRIQENDQAKGPGGEKYPEALGGTSFGGHHSDQGYTGAPSSASTGTEGSGVYNTGLGSGGSGSSGLKNAEPAPSYASIPVQETRPKGTNIKEGGFDSDAPNASFTTEIGTDKDPGRLAELKFQKQANAAADVGSAGTQKDLDTDHQYQTLKSDEAA